jgi:hypothetical protein
MDLGYLPTVPMRLISVAARDLALRAAQLAAAARLQLPGWPAVAVLALVCAAWLINAADWSHGDMRILVAASLGSLVATAALAVGWSSEPDKLEIWSLRALAAAVASVLPVLVR